MPNILHQILQRIVKHLIIWLASIFRPAAINARCRAIPPNHKVMLFSKGITKLFRVLGQEHKKICCILLRLIHDLPVPDGRDLSRIVRAICAIMDFLFIAQYQSQKCDTIHQIEDCLSIFHNNKNIFLNLEVRENFNLPKLHSLSHYTSSIQLFGMTDNYNTKQFKCLYIDFTKKPYYVSNCKDEYFQMSKWLECHEKVQLHAALID